MSYSVGKRNESRKIFAESGLAYADLTRADMEHLRKTIDIALKEAGTIKNYRMTRSIRMVKWPNGWAALTCQSYYFESREAVTFNSDGFVGFAGWADDENVKPILTGFSDWVAATSKMKADERALMLESGAS